MEWDSHSTVAHDEPERALEPGLEITWGRATKVWWSLVWRGALFGGLAGFVAGFVLGFFMAIAGASHALIGAASLWAGMLVGIPVGIWVVRNVLAISWSDFRIVLVPRTDGWRPSRPSGAEI